MEPTRPDQIVEEVEPQLEPDMPEGAISEEELEQLRAEEVAFSWQASEYVHHVKGVGWYASLIGATVVLVLIMAVLQFWLVAALFVVMAVSVLIYARKPPRTLTYELTHDGITVEGKPYPYRDFRAFSVMSEPEWHSIELEPRKRFAPPMSLLFEDQDYETIVSHLELHLPQVQREPDIVEKITRYIRF